MKLIKHWFDKRDNIINYLYETSNGVQLLSAVNPVTTDLSVSVAFRAGSCFETLVGVPTGTAHFLEHLLCKPNHIFKTRRQIDAFEYGNRDQPALRINAATSKKYIYVYGYCNERGGERLLKRLRSIILYPTELFEKYIEEERKIILAEMMSEPKPEKDRNLSYDAFSPGRQLPHFVHRIIGTYDDVKGLTVNDLMKYHSQMMGCRQVIFSTQSRVELTKQELEWFEDVAQALPCVQKEVRPPQENVMNFHDFCYFRDDHDEGVFYSVGFFQKIPRKTDYRDRVLYHASGSLLNKRSYDILREKKGLIYGFDLFIRRDLAFENEIYGFSCSVEDTKAKEALDAIYDLLYVDIMKFMKSAEAKRWFESMISTFIFPHTSAYDPDYAESRMIDLFEGRDIYLFTKSVTAAKKLTLSDLVEYLQNGILRTPPHVWVSSSHEAQIIEPILRDSALARRWGRNTKLRNEQS